MLDSVIVPAPIGRRPTVVAVRPGSAAELRSRGLDVDVVEWASGARPPRNVRSDIVLGAAMADSNLLPWLTDVTWVHATGVGVDGLLPELTSGRVVTNTPGANANAIAEFAFGAVLAAAKRFPETWAPSDSAQLAPLDLIQGRTLGLIGYGNIGRAVAARAQAFDMTVIAHRSRPHKNVDGVRFVSIDELAASADHLVLAAPSTPATRHIVNHAFLALTRPGLHLVNVARGALVDQEALRPFLDSGHVARASLDTVEPEPLPANHWLQSHPRVRLSPHMASSSPRSVSDAVDRFIINLERYLAGHPLQNVVLDNRQAS